MCDEQPVAIEIEHPDPATPSNDPDHLRDRPLPIRHVVEHGCGDGRIERLSSKRERPAVTLPQLHQRCPA